nr:T9SS type A sorting domain-containing protein [uncultured Psychroserpens sp.]
MTIKITHQFNIILILISISLGQLYGQNGTLDTSFGTNGMITTPISNSDDNNFFKALLETDDGKILAGGTAGYEFATLLSYNQDGSLNTAFGTNGKLILNFNGSREHIKDMIKQPDGKILITSETKNEDDDYDFIVARINQDGTYDTSFGNNGVATIIFGNDDERPSSLALQPDGKIIVAGYTDGNIIYKMAIARLLPNGTLDNTFSDDGKQTLIINNRSEYFNDVDITFDGKIIASGGTVLASGSSQGRMAIVRYLNNGELDTTFGNNGTVVLNILSGSCISHSLMSLPDGKSLISGYAVGNDIDGTPYVFSFATVRLDINGNLDPTFGNNGKAITVFTGGTSQIFKLKISDSNEIFAVGRASQSGQAEDFAIAKYDYDGQLDINFGTNGLVTTDFSGTHDRARDFIIQPNKLILAGFSMSTYPEEQFALARYDIENALNVSEVETTKHFNITPNITSSNITIKSLTTTNIADISIIDINGKIIYKEEIILNSNPKTINLENLNKGYYFVKINTDKLTETHKIILK